MQIELQPFPDLSRGQVTHNSSSQFKQRNANHIIPKKVVKETQNGEEYSASHFQAFWPT